MSETRTAKRRRRPPEVRRDQIIKAAVKLFARRGYERTSTRDIAREAGISEGTIYRYFRSKQALLFAFLEASALQTLTSLMTKMESEDDEQAIRRFLEDRFSLLERNLPLVKVVFGEALFNRRLAEGLSRKLIRPATALVESFIARRIREGAFRKIDPTLAARVLVGHFFSFTVIWGAILCHEGERLPRKELVEGLASLFCEGIRSRAGKGARLTSREESR